MGREGALWSPPPHTAAAAVLAATTTTITITLAPVTEPGFARAYTLLAPQAALKLSPPAGSPRAGASSAVGWLSSLSSTESTSVGREDGCHDRLCVGDPSTALDLWSRAARS